MSETSTDDVFINCPFDDHYSSILDALIFTVYACGFRVRTSRELDDGGETRIEKLFSIIQQCRYGIHDISRTQLDEANKLPRFNMPLELGIFLGCKKYGGEAQGKKRSLILDTEQFRYQKFISDLAGMDIHAHGDDANTAIVETRNWLANISRRQIPGGARVVRLHAEFLEEVPDMALELELDPDALSYSDYERLVVGWLSS